MRVIPISDFDQFGKLFETGGQIGKNVRNFVFRGHSNSSWKLNSTLERLIQSAIKTGAKISSRDEFVADHLMRFRQAARGRRGNNPAKLNDHETWALGQHFGLATPLLDWSLSPYIALFFAFSSNERNSKHSGHRSVWCLDQKLIEKKQRIVLRDAAKIEFPRTAMVNIVPSKKSRMDQHSSRMRQGFRIANELSFVVPDIDENQRLIVQSGLFTYCQNGTAVDDWVEYFLPNEAGVLIRIDIADHEGQRRQFLKSLDLMNINYASLFPDISGACSHVNSMSEDFL